MQEAAAKVEEKEEGEGEGKAEGEEEEEKKPKKKAKKEVVTVSAERANTACRTGLLFEPFQKAMGGRSCIMSPPSSCLPPNRFPHR